MNESSQSRPWYRLHWGTWLGGLVVGSALVATQLTAQAVFVWTIVIGFLGWPLPYLSGGGSPTDYTIHVTGLIVDLVVLLVILVSTLFTLERWLRMPNRLQIRISTMLTLTAVMAGVLGLTSIPGLFWMAWYIRLPLLLGIGCTLYSAFRLVLYSCRCGVTRVARVAR